MRWLIALFCLLPSLALGQGPSETVWGSNPVSAGLDFFSANSAGADFETTLSLNNYDVMILNLSEAADTQSSFSVTSCTDLYDTGGPPQTSGSPDGLCDSDAATRDDSEICYTGSATTNFEVIAAISFDRSTGSGVDDIKFAFGKGTTGAIDDGNEFGPEWDRTISVNAIHGMGAMLTVVGLATNQCIAILGQVSDVSGGSGYSMHGIGISIREY